MGVLITSERLEQFEIDSEKKYWGGKRQLWAEAYEKSRDLVGRPGLPLPLGKGGLNVPADQGCPITSAILS
jgi:hypothetical protein